MPRFHPRTLRGIISYLAAILVTVFAVGIGLFMHWVAAALGPGIGLFGVDAWAGAFAGLVVAVFGIWWWRTAAADVSKKMGLFGRLIAVGVFSATLLGAAGLLEASWSMACSEKKPDVCYHLGTTAAADGDADRAKNAFEVACRNGHIEGCARLLDRNDTDVDEVCSHIRHTCRSASIDTACKVLLEQCQLSDSPVDVRGK